VSSRDDEYTEYVSARLTSLRRTAYMLCQDWHRADDLVQAAITRLYVHGGRARAADHIDADARTLLVHEFLDERRSAWARRVSLDGTVPDLAGAQPDRDAALDIQAALASLPPRQHATIVPRFYCDLTVDQAANVLGCTPGTIKSQTAKGLAGLKKALEPSEPDRSDAYGGQQPGAAASAKKVRSHG